MNTKLTTLILFSLLFILLNISIVSAADISNDVINEMSQLDDNNLSSVDVGINTNSNFNSNLNSNLNITDNNLNHDDNNLNSIYKNNIIQDNNFNVHSVGKSKVIVVDGSSYSQMENPTIQKAIDSANPGDTILITGSSYVHTHIIIDKNLTILSNLTRGTTIDACPGDTSGSGGYGAFYITQGGSGTVIKGFTFTNSKESDLSYGIMVEGASNVQITDCKSTNVLGYGILLKNVNNSIINNVTSSNSKIGISIENSNDINITNAIISNNSKMGILIELNNSNILIEGSKINYNNPYGILIKYSDNINILNNKIEFNMDGIDQSLSNVGAGILVTGVIKQINIIGNFIRENGPHGILNENVTGLTAKKEIIDNNYFLKHSAQVVYTLDSEGMAQSVYLYENFLPGAILCGVTKDKNGNPYVASDWDLKIGEIKQIKKGVYTIEITNSNGTKIANSLNSIDVTFFLNKDNLIPTPVEGEIYKVVEMKNGIATVDFRDAKFKESGNNLTVTLPGSGAIGTLGTPSAFFNINDSDIPGSSYETILSGRNITIIPSSNTKYNIYLKDNNSNPLSNATITMKLNGKTYKKITDANGLAIFIINEKIGTYTAYINFVSYNEDYLNSSLNTVIKVKKFSTRISAKNQVFVPKSGKYYVITLKDVYGNLLVGKYVKVKLNGESYNLKTNSKGQVSLKIKLKTIKTYKLSIKFAGNSQYLKSSKTTKITIQKTSTCISSKSIVTDINSTDKFTASLKTSAGKVLVNKKLFIKLNGVTYTKFTNNLGVVEIHIKFGLSKNYTVTVTFLGDYQFKQSSSKSKIVVNKLNSKIIAPNVELNENTQDFYIIQLKDSKDNRIVNKNIIVNISNNETSNVFNETTDSLGEVKIKLNLTSGNYSVNIKSDEDANYIKAEFNSNIFINKYVSNKILINSNFKNKEIQDLLNYCPDNYIIKFLDGNYEDISLVLNKPLNIIGSDEVEINTNNVAFKCGKNSNGSNITNFNIIVHSGIGILIDNASDIKINYNSIRNYLDSYVINPLSNEETTLYGYGIGLLNSSNIFVDNNSINYFKDGIYVKDSNNLNIINNSLISNNYGINYDFGVKNTIIFNNEIADSVGWYTMDVPEGPRGYGIYLNNSAVNVTINRNNIINNYLGISIDSNKSTGIVIISNCIKDSVTEGIRFNAGYDVAENYVEPIVEDNAIYRNAKGPSMMILGEVSANPFGIYGPGEWNDSLKLKLGPNWYGANKVRKWDNNTNSTGIATICPRISTTPIYFTDLSYNNPGNYSIIFYKNVNGTNIFCDNLANFELYITLYHNKTGNCVEKVIPIINGVGNFNFDKSDYDLSENIIYISVGSLEDLTRDYVKFFEYNVPTEEIPI